MTLIPTTPHHSLHLVSRRRFGAHVAAGRLRRADIISSDDRTFWAEDNTILAAKVRTILGTAHYIQKDA